MLLLQYVTPETKGAVKEYPKIDVDKMTMADVFKYFGLDANSNSFIGHAMALQNSDDYLEKCVFCLSVPADPPIWCAVCALHIALLSVSFFRQELQGNAPSD